MNLRERKVQRRDRMITAPVNEPLSTSILAIMYAGDLELGNLLFLG
jgi:hypothetical protein